MVDQTTRQSESSEHLTDDELIARYIEPHPIKSGRFDVRVHEGNRYISVWALIGQYHAAGDDAEAVVQDYEISANAMAAALAYYRRNRDAIDARLEMNIG